MNNLDLNTNKQNFIFDINENDFVEKVIEESNNKIIIVDLWAPWCGPCKQLTPLLEETINKCNGKVILAKINIDENKQLATQLRVQSIPTVIAFKNKQIVDGFQGVIPKTKIIEFIEKILGDKIIKDNTEFYIKINDLISDNHFDEANNLLEEYLVQNTEDIEAISLYIKCLIELKKFTEAKDFISGLTEDNLKNHKIQSLVKNIDINEKNLEGPTLESLKRTYKQNPKKISNLILLSEKYFVEKLTTEAFELLLNNFLIFKEKDRQKIKKKLLLYFDALGHDNNQTKIYRKKLSSILFS